MNIPHETASQQRDLWTTRLYFLLLYASAGSISPFLNLFYVHLGLNGTEIGIVAALASVVTLVASPFWANRNDQWRNPRTVLQLFLVFTALALLGLSLQTVFWGIVLVSMFQASVNAGISPLSDSLAIRVTQESNSGYGGVRVYGSLGWMLFVPVAGWLVDRTELRSSLVISAFFAVLCAACLFLIQGRHFAATRETRASIRTVIGKVIKNPMMVGAGLMIILIGVAGSGVWQFQGVYLGELGASGTIIGIAGMVGSVLELPFMIWADRLTTKWGAYRVLLLSMSLFIAVRVLVFFFPAIPVILVAEGIVGIAFSFYTVGLVRFIAQYTDEHDMRTVLALLTVTLTSLIGIISSPLAGFTFDHLGARALYPIAAAGYLLAFLSLYAAHRVRGSTDESA
jgi:PPP family 3-phenylpropionic acid transporter